MINQTAFVQRGAHLSARVGGYSTALSSRYDGWAGLFGCNHGQHTMVLVAYE